MAQSLASLNYHLVFSTKDRAPLISEEIEEQLHRYVAGILRNHRGNLIRAGGMQDHRHWLVALHREMAVAEAIRLVKSNSTPWIREKLGNRRFSWQGGYAAFSVSYSRCEAVARYIDNQKIHHRKRDFQGELRWLLETNGVAYDERYLFS
ncbi:MAG TPA: IS200/IS605 family transposase [Acidobacteriota bacterium]|nr:IS200/IS605 family transposase [Acidobacteriota bacterium]